MLNIYFAIELKLISANQVLCNERKTTSEEKRQAKKNYLKDEDVVINKYSSHHTACLFCYRTKLIFCQPSATTSEENLCTSNDEYAVINKKTSHAEYHFCQPSAVLRTKNEHHLKDEDVVINKYSSHHACFIKPKLIFCQPSATTSEENLPQRWIVCTININSHHILRIDYIIKLKLIFASQVLDRTSKANMMKMFL